MTLEATNLRETVRADGKSGALNVNRFFSVPIMAILLLGGKLKREEYP